MPDLTGKRALVTGGNRGIGAAVVRRLHADGASVVFSYRSGAEAGEALAAELDGPDRRVVAIRADVTSGSDIKELVGTAAGVLGGLDILVSNAGIEHFGPLADITFADYERVFGTNVAGQLFVTQAAVPFMEPGARIVLMSSVSARLSVFEHSLYAASKAAVVALAANLAPELATRGIAVNVIAPGGTRSDMAAENSGHYLHPKLRHLPAETLAQTFAAEGRLAEPEEIASAIAFLASADSAYMNGSVLPIDGCIL